MYLQASVSTGADDVKYITPLLTQPSCRTSTNQDLQRCPLRKPECSSREVARKQPQMLKKFKTTPSPSSSPDVLVVCLLVFTKTVSFGYLHLQTPQLKFKKPEVEKHLSILHML